MLGVLKRRWKPKRGTNASRIPTDSSSVEGNDKDREKPPRLGPHARQVHPVYDEKTQICYDKHCPSSRPPSLNEINASPPPYPKRASLESNHSPTQVYPQTPNICVEAGRIQFIRQDTEGGDGVATLQERCTESAPHATPSIAPTGRITVARGSQTDEEQSADAKKSLENRITELEAALDAAQKNELRDKQHIAKLQKQISRRESAQRDADRERRLRVDSETRAKQALQEAARARSRLKLLTNEFARMEETVRSMLVYRKQAEQLRQEKAALNLAFENRCQQYQSTINRLNHEVSTLRQQLEQVGLESNPESILQAHAAALQRHAEESRKQYERCLDDVANQVVRALLAQKGLREEVGTLNNRIEELETQNRALTSMLMHQLRGDSVQSTPEFDATTSEHLALEEKNREDLGHLDFPSSNNDNMFNVKHCNSFNSEVLDTENNLNAADTNCALLKVKKRLSADSDIIDTRLSLEDKKRHQVLTKLWTELRGTEVTPKKLLEALTTVDSALWVPPKRPVSLNLQLPILQASKYRKTRLIQVQSGSKSEEDTTGNDSPESGNRDEGYSTMSSDVQADVTRSSGDTTTNRELEDLKEATDETEIQEARLLVTDNKDPDILYIPLNLINLKSRNSYPPGKDVLPFQHIMRSFSDSHLCIKITTAPSPYYTFSSPISSSPSIVLLDITEKSVNQLKRTKGTNTLWGNLSSEPPDDKLSQLSWSSSADDRLECTTWDAEYIQHWLRLDETRSALQQQHRDMFELDYDRAELEDWSLSLSSDDLRDQWKRLDATTPGQISISTLPSIQENNTLELEEDSSECLWNNSSYMMDKEGRELVTLLMDPASSFNEKAWPYAISTTVTQQISPDNSWSSGGSDCCHSHEPETCSKRSSAALSGCSDDTNELPAVGTDFTRDFYRLVKFESTKSLASTSSRALSENGEKETTLQNVLTFIAEQQKYVSREPVKDSRLYSVDDITKEFNIEGPPQNLEELKICDSDLCLNKSEPKSSDNENYVTLKQLCQEFTINEQNNKENIASKIDDNIKRNIAYANEVCLVTPLDVESESCSNISEVPVDICSSINVEITSTEYQSVVLDEERPERGSSKIEINSSNDLLKSSDTSCSDISTSNCGMTESVISNISTPETVVSRIPRRKSTSKIPTSPIKSNNNQNERINKLPKSKIPHKTKPKAVDRESLLIVHMEQTSRPQHVITSECLPQSSSSVVSNIIDGPPHRAVSFHECATSKDVIDELNRMIKNGDENVSIQEHTNVEVGCNTKLDEACRSTGWIHVEREVDLTDPKARANLLDVMMASVSSDSSPTSSCGGSVASDSTEDPPDYNHLHRIHRFHRQKKACAVRPEMAVVRASQLPPRPTIIGRSDFFVRYGEKEREAVASFDFLDELSTTSSSLTCSIEENADPVESTGTIEV